MTTKSKLPKQKVSGALKQFVDVSKSPTRVIGSTERFALAKPSDDHRRTDVLHPSEMAKSDWCYRASYYLLQGFPPAPSTRKQSLQMRNVFQNGHDVHSRWQRDWQDMGILYGQWKCSTCGTLFLALSSEPNPCGCKSKPKYEEVPLNYSPLKISGRPDGWLIGLGDPILPEIKSVGVGTVRFEQPDLFYEYDGHAEKIFNAIKAPFYSHINQAQIYAELINLLGLPNAPKEIVFIYEDKGSQKPKEFVIPVNTFSVKPLFEAAGMIVDAISNQTPPMCNIDPGNGCSKCNYYTEEIIGRSQSI